MTGNVVVNGVSNLTAPNIKKGTVVGGVTCIFEEFVAFAVDLYYRGNNPAGWVTGNGNTYVQFDSGQITLLSNLPQYSSLTATSKGILPGPVE